MDVASRFQPRARAQSFLDREKAAMLDEHNPEAEMSPRRKYQRTDPATTDSTGQFRKPSLPASATRQTSATHQRQISGSSNSAGYRQAGQTNTHRRRTSAIIRDNMRIPSGPREYPGSPGKTNPSIPKDAPSTTTSQRHSFLPSSTSMPFFGTNLTYSNQPDLTRGSFDPIENMSKPSTPASQLDRDTSGSLDFLPAINFDEFQTSIGTLDSGSDFGHNDLLDEFPAIAGNRTLRSDTARARAMATMHANASEEQGGIIGRSSIDRELSFRQRLADRSSRIPSDTKSAIGASPAQSTKSSMATKARRQSTIPGHPPQEAVGSGSVQKMPRSSTTSSFNQGAVEQSGNIARSASFIRARRIATMNAGEHVERSRAALPTAGRQTKAKSILPTSVGSDPNTPVDRQNNKNQTGSQTPSSSGRRQSVVSGRASGLGARTISPTDARRYKRASVAPEQPPMPFTARGPSTPGEEPLLTFFDTTLQHRRANSKSSEVPRLIAAPSPSLIPTRKDTSSLDFDSARASPSEGTGSAFGKSGSQFPVTTSTPGLSSKSSYASLHTASSANTQGTTQSRVPVPKSRNQHSNGGTTTLTNDDSQAYGELIPPVPAIPKGYESPKEHETTPFSNNATSKGSLPQLPGSYDETRLNHDGFPTGEVVRSSFESDRARHGGTRKSPVGARLAASAQTPRLTTAPGQEDSTGSFSAFAPRYRSDQNGRQNSNLQPMRLPPLNLMPMSSATRNAVQLIHTNQELDERDPNHWTSGMHTPDWSNAGHKTPSTPMTASKATFTRQKPSTIRSSTSHFVLRDNSSIDAEAMRTGWLEDSDDAGTNGVLMPSISTQNFSRATGTSRNAITPFASGSLPKGSGEYTRLHGRPSGELTDDAYFLGNSSGSYDGLRLAKAKTFGVRPTVNDTLGRSISIDQVPNTGGTENFSPATVTVDKEITNDKKEGGLRRKLSLGWRRSGSKAASRADNHKLDSENRKEANSMLPPRLPASMAFTGDGSLGISTSARPSLDGDGASVSERMRRRTDVANKASSTHTEQQGEPNCTKVDSLLPKTRSQHSERPQPVSGSRANSWGAFNGQSGVPQKSLLSQTRAVRHGHSASTISALVKDKDDLAADEEMRRLTSKKKDVDSVAKVTEELLSRALPKPSIDLDKVLHDRHNSLNIFERGEVIEYETDGVYFTGTKHATKIVGSLHPSSQPIDAKEDKSGKATNYGYDDERGDYNIVFGDHLAYRYEVCDILGKGSFGQVVRCIDHKEGGVVAIKIIRNKKRFHQQALVEVGILGKLREWDPEGTHATLSITGSFYFRSHLCIVTPCLSINLYELIRAHNFGGFPLPLIRRFARQLLACLVLLQQKRVIHCDLKPENILLCSARAADVRVIDFGSSCREEEKVYTYIQSRFYRSPEVILGSSYGLGIDMWSFGCILAELWTGYPIFPGENEQDQLACIMEIFGPPDRQLVERCTRKKLFFDSVGKPRVTVSSKGRRRRPSSKTLQQALKTDDDAFVDFVARCLRWDPERRMKPHEACSHPFITNQPLHQRQSIPEEARRAIRVRSTAAVPAASSSSPVKRTNTIAGSTMAQPMATPQKNAPAIRGMPDTPQTTLRAPVINTSITQVSPAKATTNRRQSTVASAGGSAALANSRRQSSGAALAASMNLASTKAGGGSLAEKAARESMAAMAASNAANAAGGSGRWRV